MNTSAKPSARRSTPTKAQLEATVNELRASLEKAQQEASSFADLKDALEESHKKESYLQQQIADLQSNLKQQNESLNKIQKELHKIEQIKTEFEQAKKAAVKLAEANEKLTQEVNTLKKENEDLKAQTHEIAAPMPGRPIQKETEKPSDFARNSWLL